MAIDTKSLKLPSRRVDSKRPLDKELIEVAETDYRLLGQQIAAQEIALQKRGGSKVTHLLVDGRTQRPLGEWRRNIRALFLDATVMLAALRDGWAEIMRLARVETGATRAQFEIWLGDRKIGNDPSAATAEAIRAGVPLRIVGPRVAYVRKYRFWFGRGQRLRFRRSRDRSIRGVGISGKQRRVALSMHEAVVRSVQRKYRQLRIRDAWVDVPNVNPGGRTSITRIPTVTIASAARGRL